jgi:hypothetical protein
MGCEPPFLSADKAELPQFISTVTVGDGRKYFALPRESDPSPSLESSPPVTRPPARGARQSR